MNSTLLEITIGRVVDDKALKMIYDYDIPAYKRDEFIAMLDEKSYYDSSYGWIKSKLYKVLDRSGQDDVFVFTHLNRHIVSMENGFDDIYKFECVESHSMKYMFN